MLTLDERQRRFVLEWIAAGGKDAAACARRAGYADKSDAAKVTAHRLLRNPKVIAALREEADKCMGTMAVLAIVNLKKLLTSGNPKIQQKAIDSVLDRTGYGRSTTQDVRVEHVDSRSTAELVALMQQFQRALPAPIEGEFKEVAKRGD